MKTAVAAPADDGRERFLWALQALLEKRVSGEAYVFRVMTRHMLEERRALSRHPHAGGREL